MPEPLRKKITGTGSVQLEEASDATLKQVTQDDFASASVQPTDVVRAASA